MASRSREGRCWLRRGRQWPATWSRLRSLFSTSARPWRLDVLLLGVLDAMVFRVAYVLEALALVAVLGFYLCCCGCRL